ncbi:MAG: uracil-DNA glycosylase [Neisseriaceae bacterium]|nr:MAG: uracil-DNA glycosylase [Neisseriaceae bacterium]
MKKTLDLLIPTLWKFRQNIATEFKISSLKTSLSESQVEKKPTKLPEIQISTTPSKVEETTPEPIIEIKQIIDTITPPKTINISPESITTWQELEQAIKSCDKCQLWNGRTNVVIDKGNRNAKWMFIGEAPNAQEKKQGLPFVGEIGDLLNKMIIAMNLKISEDVYITNLIKCCTPEYHNPKDNEIQQCYPYLKQQIELVKPDIIVTLGKFSSQTLLNSDLAINKLRNQVHEYNGIPLIATFHPSYLLRAPENKKLAWDDLQLAMQTLAKQ